MKHEYFIIWQKNEDGKPGIDYCSIKAETPVEALTTAQDLLRFDLEKVIQVSRLDI